MNGPNPFVGPRPFELGERLFGRDREIGELQLRLSAERVVLLHSPSGAGKSSLVQAGLVPLLAGSFDIWGPVRVNAEPAMFGTNSGTNAATNRYVSSVIQRLEESVPAKLRQGGESLAGYFEKRPRRKSAPGNVLLIIDQFEEILTVDPLGAQAKHEFFAQLGELLRNPRVWALFALREDYLAPLDPYARQVPTHLKNRFRLDLLGLAAARKAMVEPVRQGGREFVAVDELVKDLAMVKVQQADGTFVEEKGQHVEPVQLQVVCRRLWAAMPADNLSIDADDLKRFGDVTQALSGYYADSVAEASEREPGRERAIRDWFGEKLITVGGIRGQVLREAGASGGLANDLIDKLRASHLVRAERRAGATWYELAHDRLIEPVTGDNASWQMKHLVGIQRRAALWERQGRPVGLLLAGEELVKGECWAKENSARTTEAERKFLAESSRAQKAAERERRQVQRIRWLALWASIVGVMAIALGGFAGWQWRQAERQKQEVQRALAQASVESAQRLIAAGRKREGLSYLARAVRLDYKNSATRSRVYSLLLSLIGPIPTGPLRHERAYRVAFSPDGLRLVTTSRDSTVRLWDAETGEPLTEPLGKPGDERNRGGIPSAAFSRDGRRIVAISGDGMVRVWDVAEGKPLGAPMFPTSRVASASFSADGQAISTVSSDGTSQEWDATTGAPLRKTNRPVTNVQSTVVSPNGHWLVRLSGPTTRVENTVTGKLLGEPVPHEGGVISVLFSSDRKWIVTTAQDGWVRLWDATTGNLSRELRHGVISASFSPDSKKLATASIGDGTVRVWDVVPIRPLGIPIFPKDHVTSAVWSPDGEQVLTASETGSAQLWSAQTGEALGAAMRHEIEIHSAVFSPDGRRVLTASADNTARLWDEASRKPVGEPMHHGDAVYSALFSPDGRRLVTSSADGTARLWDVPTGKPLGEPMKPEDGVRSASFSPDGRRVVTVSGRVDRLRLRPEGGTARLWDGRSGKLLGEPLHHDKEIYSATFSPDGQQVVTAAADGTACLWDASSGKRIGMPMRHEDKVYSATFSPNGKRVVTASANGMARLWDTATGRELGEPMRHERAVLSAKFSSDGQRVVTASADGTARLWDAATGTELGEPFRHNMKGLSSATFSRDGSRVMTRSSLEGTVWLWDVPIATESEARLVAETAEAVGGYRVTDIGNLEPILPPERRELLSALRKKGELTVDTVSPAGSFLRWYFTPSSQRTISPFSLMTVDQYVRRLLETGNKDLRLIAEGVLPGNGLSAAE